MLHERGGRGMFALVATQSRFHRGMPDGEQKWMLDERGERSTFALVAFQSCFHRGMPDGEQKWDANCRSATVIGRRPGHHLALCQWSHD
jgi:hypothetical protein